MSDRHFRTPLVLALLISLAACSGGTIPQAVPATQNDERYDDTDARATAQLAIEWNNPRPAESVRIDVSEKSAPSTILSTKIVNRSKHGGASSLRISVPARADVFAFTVFDQPYARGNELGGARIVRTIQANATNSIRATFVGYAAGFAVDSNAIEPVFTGPGETQPIYDVPGEAALAFGVSVLDADGRVILPPGVPKVRATSDDPSTFRVRKSKGQNQFTVQAVGPMGIATPHLVLEGAGAGGSVYTTSYQLAETALLVAAAGSGAGAHVYAFDTLGRRYALPGSFTGLNRPIALALDDAHDRLYVADAGASKILAYDGNGNAISGWTAPSVPSITGVAYSAHSGHVYASTSAGSGSVDVFDSKGAVVATQGFTGRHGVPIGITYDPNLRTIAVLEGGTPGYLDVYTDGGLSEPSLSSQLLDSYGDPFQPTGVSPALDGKGDFWITGADYSPYDEGPGSAPDPVAALYWSQGSASYPKLQAGGGFQASTGYVDGQMFGITSPIAVAANPSAPSIFYVVEASGPMWGFNCSLGTCIGDYPWVIKPTGLKGSGTVVSVPGYGGTIRQPGTANFTAAVFDQY
jgi:hypothetical protein